MMRITHQRKSRYLTLGYSCTEKEWDKRLSRFIPPKRGYKQKNAALSAIEEKVDAILTDFKRKEIQFSIERFIDEFQGVTSSVGVFEFYEMLIKEFISKNRIGNSETYRVSMNSLRNFKPKGEIAFQNVNYQFLKAYERYLFERGCKKGGAHVYMRTFRAVLNEAIRQGYMDQKDYPFSTQFNKKGYSISHLKPETQPRALSIADMEKIKAFPFNDEPHLANAVRYFLFSYYARGINFTDLAKLTWKDIYNDRISYIRSKTGKLITFRLSESMKDILVHYKGMNPKYVFPILNDFHKESTQIYNRIKKCRKAYNKDLKEVGSLLEINAELTSYVARHTFATTLKMKNANIAMISQALGHADLATTETYLKKFDNDAMDSLDELL